MKIRVEVYRNESAFTADGEISSARIAVGSLRIALESQQDGPPILTVSTVFATTPPLFRIPVTFEP